MSSAVRGVEIDVDHSHHLNFEKRFQFVAERANNLNLRNLIRLDTNQVDV